MTRTSLHAQTFLQQLSANQRDWLRRHALQTRQLPPSDWIAWYGDSFFLGWVPAARADQLVARLPLCTRRQQRLTWETAHQSSLQRSQDLQFFITEQAQRGLLGGWRNEFFSFWLNSCIAPNPEISPWLCIERAGFRHLGLMSHAVHINGFCPDGHMWAGRRASNKATDPGKLDNLTAGGIPAGESAEMTVRRELQEEAGWNQNTVGLLHGVSALRTQRTEPEGWHDETLWVYNLDLPHDFSPVNKDGEVESFHRWSPHDVIARIQAGEFTADASLALCRGLGLMST
jgi:isopentenyldiphosphate isomerase